MHMTHDQLSQWLGSEIDVSSTRGISACHDSLIKSDATLMSIVSSILSQTQTSNVDDTMQYAKLRHQSVEDAEKHVCGVKGRFAGSEGG